MPIDKPWLPFDGLQAKSLPGSVGVYELGDARGDVIFIGYAGGRSLFGIRGALLDHRSQGETNPIILARADRCRYEVTTNYLIRHLELLSRFREDYNRLPRANESSRASLPPLARYHWSTIDGL
jgi:hypothetical protein